MDGCWGLGSWPEASPYSNSNYIGALKPKYNVGGLSSWTRVLGKTV